MASLADSQIDTLAESYKDLQDAKNKFKESLDAIKVQKQLPDDKAILVPLTGSMYVPGHITNSKQFLIDIGPQYLVEKDADGAMDYFERKMKFIDSQLEKFAKLLEAESLKRQEAMAAAAKSSASSSSAQPKETSSDDKTKS